MKEKIIEIIEFDVVPKSTELKAQELIILFNEHILTEFKKNTDNNINHFINSIWINF